MVVVEGAVDGRRAAGVEVLAQIVEHAVALVGAEPALESREQLGILRLVAAALAEELVLERVEGVDVGGGKRRVGRVGRLQVSVDALTEHLDVTQHFQPLGPGVLEHLALTGDDALGLGRWGELVEMLDEADRGQPGCLDRGNERVVTRLLEQQPAVLGGDPPGGPYPAVVGGGGDVRDVVAVSDDGHARVRDGLVRARALSRRPEFLGFEVLGGVGVRDVIE